MNELGIFSGQCLLGVCGTPTQLKDAWGNELSVGDIVVVASESYTPDNFTVVVMDGFETYTNGKITSDPEAKPFVMGWKTSNFENLNILKLKSFKDCIPDEHWPAFGFSYGMIDTALITSE